MTEREVYYGLVCTKPFHAESRLKCSTNSIGWRVAAAHQHFSGEPWALKRKILLRLQAGKVAVLV